MQVFKCDRLDLNRQRTSARARDQRSKQWLRGAEPRPQSGSLSDPTRAGWRPFIHLGALSLLLSALAPAVAVASPARSPWPAGVTLPPGKPVSEDYRREFDACDQKESFRGRQPRYVSCAGDPNRVTALRRLPGGAIAWVSKLAVDLDGSAFACGPDHGREDQCPTALMLPDGKGGEVPVDADRIHYVVIPDAGPPEVAHEFRQRTGLDVGDFGVVIARGRVVPVIVADTGPFSKLGEGSIALHRALGHEECAAFDHGVCSRVDNEGQSLSGNVTTVIFPGSAREDLTPATIGPVTRREGLRLWHAFQRRSGAQSRSSSRR